MKQNSNVMTGAVAYIAMGVVLSLLVIQTGGIESVETQRASLADLSVQETAELKQIFEAQGYAWPPATADQVPALAVKSLPADLVHMSVKERKALFFLALLPIVMEENRLIAEERKFLQNYFNARLPRLTASQQTHLDKILKRYRIKGDISEPAVQARALRKVDEIPVSLVLAQAANESGWGTSRFAREGNSLFGQWTYRKTGGLVPQGRDEGASYSVRAFSDIRGSVRAYLRNLNMGHAYGDLRHERARMREAGYVDGMQLTAGLIRYSQRGQAYVDEIRAMIRSNQLDQLTL